MKNREEALKIGFLSLLPVLDEAGRAIIYSNSTPYKAPLNPEVEEVRERERDFILPDVLMLIPSQKYLLQQSYDKMMKKIQVWWYLVHCAMENPDVAEKGFIILTNSRDSRLNNFDGKWALGKKLNTQVIIYIISYLTNRPCVAFL